MWKTRSTVHLDFLLNFVFTDIWRDEQEKILQQRIIEMEQELAKEKSKVDVSINNWITWLRRLLDSLLDKKVLFFNAFSLTSLLHELLGGFLWDSFT